MFLTYNLMEKKEDNSFLGFQRKAWALVNMAFPRSGNYKTYMLHRAGSGSPDETFYPELAMLYLCVSPVAALAYASATLLNTSLHHAKFLVQQLKLLRQLTQLTQLTEIRGLYGKKYNEYKGWVTESYKVVSLHDQLKEIYKTLSGVCVYFTSVELNYRAPGDEYDEQMRHSDSDTDSSDDESVDGARFALGNGANKSVVDSAAARAVIEKHSNHNEILNQNAFPVSRLILEKPQDIIYEVSSAQKSLSEAVLTIKNANSSLGENIGIKLKELYHLTKEIQQRLDTIQRLSLQKPQTIMPQAFNTSMLPSILKEVSAMDREDNDDSNLLCLRHSSSNRIFENRFFQKVAPHLPLPKPILERVRAEENKAEI